MNPRKSPEVGEWLDRLVDAGEEVLVPEIADYELRRGLLRLNDLTGVKRLDDLYTVIGYVPITTAAMRRAAELWAGAPQPPLPKTGRGGADKGRGYPSPLSQSWERGRG